MRKGTAAILLTVFMLSHTELHQLVKIPVLLDHFREHKLEDPGLGFYAFLRMHYEKIVIDDDYQRDQQLPFRDVDCGIVNATATDIPPQLIRIERQSLSEYAIQFHPKRIISYTHLHLADIFQPPRLA
ncbi:MAG: hypothetical protein B7Z54_01845 [Sphingobacteriales bacterium 12-47-4]|nr:MAG: hypothetical protein B7Z54_01845 [Sphingobacteriales bacterium 12-47-4]